MCSTGAPPVNIIKRQSPPCNPYTSHKPQLPQLLEVVYGSAVNVNKCFLPKCPKLKSCHITLIPHQFMYCTFNLQVKLYNLSPVVMLFQIQYNCYLDFFFLLYTHKLQLADKKAAPQAQWGVHKICIIYHIMYFENKHIFIIMLDWLR